MSILGILPARIGSSRLPRKPLADICGKSLVQRAYESCQQSTLVKDFIVATDSAEIYDHVLGFGGRAEFTGEHNSGTSRMIEVAMRHPEYSYVLNLQPDQPFMHSTHIDNVAATLLKKSSDIVTPVVKITEALAQDIFNPNAVKVVLDVFDNALYFSRSPLPYTREQKESTWHESGDYLKHLGVYGFEFEILETLSRLDQSMLERKECLEQNTWLFYGFQIHCVQVDHDIVAVDTPADLELVRKIFNASQS